MMLVFLTLSFNLVTSKPYEYDFIYSPIANVSVSKHHGQAQDSTYHFDDLFENTDSSECKRNATCVPLYAATCFGSRLPYDSTSLNLVPGYATKYSIQRRLRMLQVLKSIPKCWSVVRPFMCSLFVPKCVNDTVERLSQSMCTTVFSSCRLVLNETVWPTLIDCDNEDLFMPQCRTNMLDVMFDKSWHCPAPLVPTNDSLAVFDGIDGCGIPCRDPMYTHEEHQQIRTFIAWGATTCCLLNVFAVATFLINWKSASKFPASVIFYINACFMVCCLGWLVQFSTGNNNIIVCKPDGTLRKSEPKGDISCVLIFILVYYPLMSAIIWFVILTYTWHVSVQPCTKLNSRLDKKSAYFHLLAWCLPLMLTVGVLSMSEIDGDSMTGICFIGRYNYIVRLGFVLGPVVVAILIGPYFLIRSMIRLIILTITSEGIISNKASSKLRNTIIRMGMFSVAIFSSVIITIHCHLYDFLNYAAWEQNFRMFIVCSVTTGYSDLSSCKMKVRPSVTKLQLHLFALFFTGIVMSSWVWTSSSMAIWLRCFKRLFKCNNARVEQQQQPVKLQKHEVIAQAYSKRQSGKELDWKGENPRISIDFYNEDPVGLNFDPNSVESQDISATWAAALPYMVMRRDAVVRELLKSELAKSKRDNRRSSNESYSFSVRRASIESKRNSSDPQFSMSISELSAYRQLPYRIGRNHRDTDVSSTNRRRKRKGKLKRRRLRGYTIHRSRRTIRSSVGQSHDTPATDTGH
ncbi:protein smoothened-like [Phymastichus coffea]|uniref:protein smoothened-like n=1 Tax=Phymastichus coffea TaxID=108790 RepID=UPI00273AF589|nr:protein smoothened-like [Phymastichus coffea]